VLLGVRLVIKNKKADSSFLFPSWDDSSSCMILS